MKLIIFNEYYKISGTVFMYIFFINININIYIEKKIVNIHNHSNPFFLRILCIHLPKISAKYTNFSK